MAQTPIEVLFIRIPFSGSTGSQGYLMLKNHTLRQRIGPEKGCETTSFTVVSRAVQEPVDFDGTTGASPDTRAPRGTGGP